MIIRISTKERDFGFNWQSLNEKVAYLNNVGYKRCQKSNTKMLYYGIYSIHCIYL